MSSLHDRLLSAEDDYLTALISGEDTMIAFETRWEAILADIDTALESTGLDSSTITLAHTTSLRIATLADTSAELFDSYHSLTSQLMAQLDYCMSALSLDDSSETPLSDCDLSPHPSQNRRPSPPSAEHDTSNSRKRRSASVEEVVKRPRLNVDVVAHPTKKSRRDGPPLTPIATSTIPRLDLSVVPRVTRKRRLSDATSSPPARAKRLCAGPRLHAVSDTYTTLYSSKGHMPIPVSPVQAAAHGPQPMPIHYDTLEPVKLNVHSLPCTGSPGGNDAGELFATTALNVLPPGDSDLDVFLDSSFLSFGTSSMTRASPTSVEALESYLSPEIYSNVPDQAGSPCNTSSTASSPSPPLTPRFSSSNPYTPPMYEFADCDFYDDVDISSIVKTVSDIGSRSPAAIAPNIDQGHRQMFQPKFPDGVDVMNTDGAASSVFDLLWHTPPPPYWTSSPCDASEILEGFGVGLPLVHAVDPSGKPDFRHAELVSDLESSTFLKDVPERTASVSMLGDAPWDNHSLSRSLPFTVDIFSAA